jgi:ABC-type antimicrobial peptide transport system permease subunit
VRQTLARLDPEAPPLDPRTLEDRITAATADYRMVRAVFSIFGAAGLLLSAIGLYGLVAFVAGQRRREIAVRRALGAPASQVFKLVFRGGALQVGVGAAVGLGLAVMTSRLLGAFLYGVAPEDFTSLAGAILLLFVVAGAACFGPARQAAKVDPMAVLRNE